MIGTAVGNYRVTAKVAEGGMGVVYRGEHTMIGRAAAIKVLHPELSHNRGIVDRFFNEAKATSAIRHPGIVEVLDFGYLPSGAAFLVMEFLEGETLSRYLKRRGRIPEAEAAWLIRGMCSALAAAHAKSIVHRDLKPDNVFMVADPEAATGVRPKLLDFGIAKLSGSEISSSKTRTGSVLGTPTYMSPEQCKGIGDVDHRADLYSLGCMLYEMLCGRPPFVSEGAGELIGAHLFVAPDSPRVYAPQVSPAMEQLVLRLLAKNRDQRPAHADELAETLGQLARMSGGGWMPGSTPVAPGTAPGPHPPRVQTPVRGVPVRAATGQPIGRPPGGGTPRPAMPDAATVMEPLHVPPSGPMHAGAPTWQPAPQGYGSQPGMPPHGMTPHGMPPHAMTPHGMTPHGMTPHGMPLQPTPPPMPTPPPPNPTPAPQTVTTLSGAAGVRQGQDRPRARWPVAIAVIVLFAAASATTTYLVVTRGEKKAAGGGGAPPVPTTGTPTTGTPTTGMPAVTPDAAPATPPTPVVTPDAAPVAPATPDAAPAHHHGHDSQPGSVIDLDGKKPDGKKPDSRKHKRNDPKPPGPIETDI